ncbi:heterokaryon incompatibility protein [Apiospora sp. TS-2023a]
MTAKPPKSHLSPSRSAFALIDPMDARLHRQFDRHGYLTSGLRTHVAVSYVWSEWRDRREDRLPSWTSLRARLQSLLGADPSPDIKRATRGESRCWIDCICIDQDSPEDKAHWIPRMDEIYYEARCTILLLRSARLDLSALLRIREEVRCPFQGPLRFRDMAQMVPHECILCQSCAALPATLPEEIQLAALEALRELCHSTWRQRAWILQEILLSRNYLISWDDTGRCLSLADTGVIAALLFRQNPREPWLDEYASWCRRLWFVRQNYEGGRANELCDANVLQMASMLAATVPSDRYYALCGILQLKGVKPDASHSADEALDVVVRALTEEGRMSWLYAVPPAVQTTRTGSGSGSSLKLRDGALAPFIATRSEARLRLLKRYRATLGPTSLRLHVASVGRIVRSIPLSEVLSTTFAHLRETHDFSFPEPISYAHQVPGIIRRLSLEMVDTLLSEPTFEHMCKVFGLMDTVQSAARRGWLCVMFLGFLDAPLLQEMFEGAGVEDAKMVLAAAASLQHHLDHVQGAFSVLIWRSEEGGHERTCLGYPGCPMSASVFQLRDEPEMFFAARAAPGDSAGREAEFFGPLLSTETRDALGPRPSTLLTTSFWKAWSRPANTQVVTFNYG